MIIVWTNFFKLRHFSLAAAGSVAALLVVSWVHHASAAPALEMRSPVPPVPYVAIRDFDHDRHEHFDHDHWHYRHGYAGDPWVSGVWRNGWFGGRYGWWWVWGGRRYWYDRPVYPYPPMESQIIIADPPPIIVQTPPPAMLQPPPAPPQVQAQPNMWYYCDNPAGYYPYVQSCTTPFHAVPAH